MLAAICGSLLRTTLQIWNDRRWVTQAPLAPCWSAPGKQPVNADLLAFRGTVSGRLP